MQGYRSQHYELDVNPLGSVRLSLSQVGKKPGKLTWASLEQVPSEHVCQCSCRHGLPSTGPVCLPANKANRLSEKDRVARESAVQQRPWQDTAVRQRGASSNT